MKNPPIKYITLSFLFGLLISINAETKAQSADTLYFMGNIDYPPYLLIDQNIPAGFCIDIFELIAETMGINIEIELGAWNTVRNNLEKGEIDGIVAMSYSADRSKYVYFTNPYIFVTYEVFVRKGSPIQSIQDLKNKQAVVINGDIMHDYLINNNITPNIIPVKDYETALKLLSSGKYDCALINTLQGQFTIQKYNLHNLKDLNNPFESRGICIALSKNNMHLLTLFNDGIKIIKESEKFQEIYDKWFASYETSSYRSISKYIFWSVIPATLIVLISFLWVWSLRRQVNIKTRLLQNQLNTQKEVDRALLQERSLLRSLINSIPDLIFYKDKNNQYMGCNEAFSQFSGIKLEDLIGKTDFEVYPFEEARKYAERDQKLLNDTTKMRYETWETQISGTRSLLDVIKVPFLDEQGNVLGLVGICHDITNRYKIEQELTRAKLKAEESDRLKSAFLANMSHEIRTPMNAIVGFSDLLVDDDMDMDSREELVSHINSNCTILMHLIDDIIDISQIEANEITIIAERIDLHLILNELYDYYSGIISNDPDKKLKLSFPENIRNKELYIVTDPFRLRQILNNLIDNSFKFTEEGTVELNYLLKEKESELEVMVKDTGIGIDKDHHDLIFKRFRKIEDENKLFRGTGLGLAITKSLIDKMGGKIWVDSESGKGTTFHFTLPLSTSEVLDKDKTDTTDNQLGMLFINKKIVVAEDELSNFKFLQLILNKLGIEVTHCKNGAEAIDYCLNNEVDLVLMDIKMPTMDGIQATKEIKKIKPDLPIIAQTAYVMKEDKALAMKAGCNDYITKPIKKNMLIDLLENWLA